MIRTHQSDQADNPQRIYDRLMALRRPANLTNNQWARKAGVSTSFFTNMKNGSDPSVGRLRLVLGVVGSSIPEFFADEAQGRLVPKPTEKDLQGATRSALSSDGVVAQVAQALASAMPVPPGPSRLAPENPGRTLAT